MGSHRLFVWNRARLLRRHAAAVLSPGPAALGARRNGALRGCIAGHELHVQRLCHRRTRDAITNHAGHGGSGVDVCGAGTRGLDVGRMRVLVRGRGAGGSHAAGFGGHPAGTRIAGVARGVAAAGGIGRRVAGNVCAAGGTMARLEMALLRCARAKHLPCEGGGTAAAARRVVCGLVLSAVSVVHSAAVRCGGALEGRARPLGAPHFRTRLVRAYSTETAGTAAKSGRPRPTKRCAANASHRTTRAAGAPAGRPLDFVYDRCGRRLHGVPVSGAGVAGDDGNLRGCHGRVAAAVCGADCAGCCFVPPCLDVRRFAVEARSGIRARIAGVCGGRTQLVPDRRDAQPGVSRDTGYPYRCDAGRGAAILCPSARSRHAGAERTVRGAPRRISQRSPGASPDRHDRLPARAGRESRDRASDAGAAQRAACRIFYARCIREGDVRFPRHARSGVVAGMRPHDRDTF